MSEFLVKSGAVDVDAIMRQIRSRIREKRGADYTEEEVQELAKVKLEQFLDPKGVRSDLVAQFRKRRTVSPAPDNYEFEDSTIYETHRGVLRTIRRLLNPLLKLLFNPNKISAALHLQAKVNQDFHQRFRQREDMDPLYYELVHNLALEVTRLGIEVHNMKMRVESVSSRVDFDERRGRALEQVVQYKQPRRGGQRPKPDTTPDAAASDSTATTDSAEASQSGDRSTDSNSTSQSAPRSSESNGEGVAGTEGDGERRRRRRRRRRRPGQTLGDQTGDQQTDPESNDSAGTPAPVALTEVTGPPAEAEAPPAPADVTGKTTDTNPTSSTPDTGGSDAAVTGTDSDSK